MFSSDIDNIFCNQRLQQLWHTVKPIFFRVPFISRISRAWQVRENSNTVAFQCNRKQNAKITGSKIITLIDSDAKIKGGQN